MRNALRPVLNAWSAALPAARRGLVTLALAACAFAGCSKVTTGNNDDPRLVQGGAAAGDDSSAGGDAAGSCFGATLADKVPAAMAEFCKDTPADLKTAFAKAFKTMCDEHKLVGLAQPSCAWDGTAAKQSTYLRVLEKTDPTDPAQEFTFFAAYSVAIATNPADFLDVLVKNYTDPNFGATYVPIKNSHITDAKSDAKAGTLDYTVELATSAASVKFRGHSDIKRYTSGMIGVFDRAVGDKVLIVDNNTLLLLIPNASGALYVAVDDKKVDDSGNHRLAASAATALDKERMGNSFENAKRKAGK